MENREKATIEELHHQSSGINAGIYWLAFSPDSKRLLSYGKDDAALVWNLTKPRTLAKRILMQNAKIVGFDTDGNLRALSQQGDSCVVLDQAKRQLLTISKCSHLESGAFSPDGRELALYGESEVQVFDVKGGQKMYVIPGTTGNAVSAVAYGGKESYLAIGEVAGGISLYDGLTGVLLTTLEKHEDRIEQLALSRDGRILASVDRGGRIILWDITDITSSSVMQEIQEPRSDYGFVDLEFTEDSDMLAVGVAEGFLLISVADGSTIKSYDTGSTLGEQIYVDFSPEGDLFAWATQGLLSEAVVQVEHVSGRDVIGPAMAAGSDVLSIKFSPDGKLLAAINSKGITIWDMDIRSWRERACSIANRNLTTGEWKQFFGEEPYRHTCPTLANSGAEGK